MKILTLTALAIVFWAICQLNTLEFTEPTVTTNPAVVRQFIADCEGHTNIKETDGVFELRCKT